MSPRIGTNVVPISHGRSVVRRAPVRRYPRPVALVQNAAGVRGRKAAPAPCVVTPAWVCIASLVAVTMWPSAAVLLTKFALRIFCG